MKALSGASKSAQKAFDAVDDPSFSNVPGEQKKAWAMAAIIHCDICRQVVALDECNVEGLARLLILGNIVSKLFEAQRWYFGPGRTLLKDIAKSKDIGADRLEEYLKTLGAKHKVDSIQRYSEYRNKLSYHYDENAITFLQLFSREDAEAFDALLVGFVRYAGDWAKLTKCLIQQGKIPNKYFQFVPALAGLHRTGFTLHSKPAAEHWR
ncbi:hypothetical protein [Marinobacter sp. DSM 26671]|uniref:hypothetical protein n=1 Tax=Marinobacter sp. DSM 26671 TaxID=1761793 RepID=UPI000B8788A0|nr:hypothetical protein [Marinobacter sp. DSM 26671]